MALQATVRHWTFTAPRSDKSPAQNQDRVLGDDKRLRYAVADGVSAGLDSGDWADVLIRASMEEALPATFAERDRWLEPLLARWHEEHPGQETAQGRTGSTLVATSLARTPEGFDCVATAIGDACVFLIRDSSIVGSFPVDGPGGFSDLPPRISTRRLDDPAARPEERTVPSSVRFQALPGDRVLLATDALSKFLMTHAQAGSVSSILAQFREEADWDGLVEDWRTAVPIGLDDDDVGLLVVELLLLGDSTVREVDDPGSPGAPHQKGDQADAARPEDSLPSPPFSADLAGRPVGDDDVGHRPGVDPRAGDLRLGCLRGLARSSWRALASLAVSTLGLGLASEWRELRRRTADLEREVERLRSRMDAVERTSVGPRADDR